MCTRIRVNYRLNGVPLLFSKECLTKICSIVVMLVYLYCDTSKLEGIFWAAKAI